MARSEGGQVHAPEEEERIARNDKAANAPLPPTYYRFDLRLWNLTKPSERLSDST
jgi:hypothetical protein